MTNTQRIIKDIDDNVAHRLKPSIENFISPLSETLRDESVKLSNRLQHLDGSAWHTWQGEVAQAEKLVEQRLAEELIIQLKKKYKINWQ